MEFNTCSTSKKRKMIFVPDVNPKTLLFFFEKGASGYSYSIRDYSVRDRVIERYAREFHWSADELCQRARYIFDAPTVDTHDLSFWHSYTSKGNEFLRNAGAFVSTGVQAAKAVEVSAPPRVDSVGERFPILDFSVFQSLPKFAKTGDVERILTSSRSEDWVTWNLLRLILGSSTHWGRIIQEIVSATGGSLELSSLVSSEAHLSFWRTTKAPPAYEAASRRRMTGSSNPLFVARASDPRPVEGNSEIDIVIESPALLIFVEAKLMSDISLRTTYDPFRNQIVRNIDCLIEESRGRSPMFWMVVRDLEPSRAYVQLMRQYRDDPRALIRDLPHRDPALLKAIAERLVMVTWRDLAKCVCDVRPEDDELVRAVKEELLKRISR